MSTDSQTTLAEFADDETDRDDTPTPADNAENIRHLIRSVERLTDQVGTLVDEVDDGDDDELTVEVDLGEDPRGFH